MSIIPSGFSTRVTFDSDILLATSLQISESTPMLESASGYGGSMLGTNMAMGSPYLVDHGEVTGSFSYDPSLAQLQSLISWISTRNATKSLTVDTSDGSSDLDLFMTSLSFGVAENENVNAEVGFWSIVDSFDSTRKYGGGTSTRDAVSVPAMVGNTLIPYWKTGIVGLGSNDDVLAWTVNFSQDFVKKFFCDNDTASAAPEPDYVLVGPLSCELNVTHLITADNVPVSGFALSYATGLLRIKVGTTTIVTLKKPETTSGAPAIAEAGSYLSFDSTHRIHQIQIP